MIVANAAPAPIADMIFTEQVLFVDIPLGAIRCRPLTGICIKLGGKCQCGFKDIELRA